jgi:hypothetical protein
MSRKGGRPTYKARLGKGRSPRHSRHSIASTKYLHRPKRPRAKRSSSACASAISGVCKKPSSAGARTAWRRRGGRPIGRAWQAPREDRRPGALLRRDGVRRVCAWCKKPDPPLARLCRLGSTIDTRGLTRDARRYGASVSGHRRQWGSRSSQGFPKHRHWDKAAC